MPAFGGNRTVAVNLSANVNDYVAKMRVAQKATQDFGRSASQSAKTNRQDWDRLGAGMGIAGAAIGAGLAVAVKSAAEFDKQLSAVRAVSNASAADMDRLRAAALKAGADTAFSAKEAAEAETELAKVGISTSDILGGALTGSLSLAAAGQLDLGRAAEISGQAMKVFGLAGQDVGHIADVLSAGANKSAADVEQLSQAMSQGGLVAAQTGLSLEDTVGALSAFADNALMGSDAGTSLKTMLQRLNPSSDEAASLMDELGLRAYDAQGNFVGLEQYAGQLQRGLGGLSVEQRNAAMSTIFGSDAVRASNILYKLGADGVREYTGAVNDQGAAARVAATQMDNLSGDFEQLRGSIETALIKSGSAGNDALRGLTQAATGAVNAFGSLPDSVQGLAFGLGGVASAALLAGGAALTIVPKVAAAKASLDALALSSGRASVALRGVGAAAGVIALAAVAVEVGEFAGQAQVATVKTDDLVASMRDLAAGGQMSAAGLRLFRDGFGPLANDATTTGEALENFGINAYNALDQGWDARLARIQSFGNATGQFGAQVRQADAALAAMVQQGSADAAAEAFHRLTAAAVAQGVPVAVITARFSQYQAALDTAKTSSGHVAASTGVLGESMDVVSPKVADTKDSVKRLSDALKGLYDAAFAADAAADEFHSSLNGLSKAAKDNGASLHGNSDKAIGNRAALRGAAKAALDALDAYAANGHTTDQVSAKADKYRRELVRQATQAGFTKRDVNKYADALRDVPGTVKSQFQTPGLPGATDKVKALRDAILGIHDKNVSISVATGTANKLSRAPMPNAEGGYISGPGGPTDDKIPALLSNGEYVIRASSVARYGSDFFEGLNSGRFAQGGQVGSMVTLRGMSDLTGAMAQVVKANAAAESAAAAARGAGGAGGVNVKVPGGAGQAGLIALGHWFQSLGARVSEHPRFGGVHPVHVRGSAHYAGRAIDVNYGAGTSRREQAFFDRLVGAVRAKGFKVLWRVPGHFNHLHAAYARGGKVGTAPARGSVGVRPRRFATGGAVLGGDYSGISSIVQARQVWSRDDLKQRIDYAHQWDKAIATASKALAKARHDLAKAHTAAARREARQAIEDATDRRREAQRRAKLADQATANVRRGLASQSRPLSVRFAEAAESRNSVTAGFIKNVTTLANRGFGNLARQFMEMGGSDAETLAAQAVRSTATARRLQSDLTRSAGLAAQAESLPGQLAIRSALATSRNPSLAGIAAATGMSVSDLQVALRTLAPSLKGNGNAKTLLAGIKSQGFYSNGSFGSTSASSGPSFQITVQNPTGDPYRAGEKAAQGVQRVLATQGAW